MILEISELSKNFGSLAALSKVSFQIEKGEIFGIAGPNGAGKSTLFNVIAGHYSPTSGKVRFDGHDITGLKPHRICGKGIGRTFQIPTTFHSLNVYDNLRAGTIFGGGSLDRLSQVIDFLDLSTRLQAPATNLDLYTTKLVMLGTVLATDCKLLMLDEPMAGFSMVEIGRFVDLVRRINLEWGITVLIIEHLLDILVDLSNRLLILDNGQIIAVGHPPEVIQNPRVVEGYLGKRKGGHDAQS